MRKSDKKLLIDVFLWSLATPIAYLLRLAFPLAGSLGDIVLATTAMIPVKMFILYATGSNKQSWHKIGVLDIFSLAKCTLIGAIVFFGMAVFFRSMLFIPYSVPILDLIVSFLLLNGVRFTVRLLDEYHKQEVAQASDRKNILIIGAGDVGTMMAREILRHPESKMNPVGFLDDDIQKQSSKFLGLPVLGPLNELKEIALDQDVDEVLIAMPSAPGKIIRKVVEKAQEVDLDHKIIPALHELLSGDLKISQIREVDVKDLLKREPVSLENEEISDYLRNRTVVITGAGGSIGSEILRQVLKFDPSQILMVDNSEYNMYKIDQELQQLEMDTTCLPQVADICDYDVMETIIQDFKPDVIFHAAAHKHVPLMEYNPEQAILNNVGGTKNLVDLALKYGVKRFVNVSTDKAVNPTSVMGTSKRIAEKVVDWGANQSTESQVFVSVRFGNVLGSRGSVIPKFKQQIKEGKPVTVTHPEMTRYFMTIPEASQLVLQAAGQAQNGSVYVLDMGEPVRIMDMARDLIKLSGLQPGKDIPIVISGIRPGEKLYEELLTAEEGTSATQHDKIYVAKKNGHPDEHFEEVVEELFDVAYTGNPEQIKMMFKRVVPSYKYEPNGNAKMAAS